MCLDIYGFCKLLDLVINNSMGAERTKVRSTKLIDILPTATLCDGVGE